KGATNWRGMWGYTLEQDSPDHSISQYGVLGMWALAQVGAEIPNGVWAEMERTWLAHQSPEGGWQYTTRPPNTLSMTAAGVASLFITQDHLHASQGADCKGNINNPAIDKGMAWIAENLPSLV